MVYFALPTTLEVASNARAPVAAQPAPPSPRCDRTRGRYSLPMRLSRPGVLVLLALAPVATAQVVPTDGQVFTSSAVLAPGTYNLPNGVSIGASGVTLDLNGATLQGTGAAGAPRYGVSSVGWSNVVIKN